MINTTFKSKVRSKSNVQVIPAKKDIISDGSPLPRKRVCAYCRVSTEEEDQQSSYDLQVRYYTEFIKKNELWEFVDIYADEGISGTSIKNRIDFQRMIKDSQEGKIDLVITKSISRFARNTLDCLNYVRMLKSLPSPVGIYFEKENIDTLDSKSELLLTILSSIAQDESRSTSENIKWAIQKMYQQGKAHCPTAFFLGYDTDKNGNLVINEEQAKTVRRIYNECLSGYGTEIIARKLTEDGIKTGKGEAKWCSNSVCRILRNEKYCGDILMQKRVTVDFLTHKRVPNRGLQPKYFIEDHHPAIISKEDWYAVQTELNRRHNMNIEEDGISRRHSNASIFSNILYCGTCGQPFMRRSFTKNSKITGKTVYSVMKCRVADGRVKDKECHAPSYREESMKHAFMVMLLDMKHNMDEVNKQARDALKDIMLDKEEIDRMNFLQNKIEFYEIRLRETAVESIRSKLAWEVYEDLSVELTQEIEILQSELEELNEKKHESMLIERKLEWLIKELNALDEFDSNIETTDFRDDIFKQIVIKADVYEDAHIVYELSIGIIYTAYKNNIIVSKLGKDKNKAS